MCRVIFLRSNRSSTYFTNQNNCQAFLLQKRLEFLPGLVAAAPAVVNGSINGDADVGAAPPAKKTYAEAVGSDLWHCSAEDEPYTADAASRAIAWHGIEEGCGGRCTRLDKLRDLSCGEVHCS